MTKIELVQSNFRTRPLEKMNPIWHRNVSLRPRFPTAAGLFSRNRKPNVLFVLVSLHDILSVYISCVELQPYGPMEHTRTSKGKKGTGSQAPDIL